MPASTAGTLPETGASTNRAPAPRRRLGRARARRPRRSCPGRTRPRRVLSAARTARRRAAPYEWRRRRPGRDSTTSAPRDGIGRRIGATATARRTSRPAPARAASVRFHTVRSMSGRGDAARHRRAHPPGARGARRQPRRGSTTIFPRAAPAASGSKPSATTSSRATTRSTHDGRQRSVGRAGRAPPAGRCRRRGPPWCASSISRSTRSASSTGCGCFVQPDQQHRTAAGRQRERPLSRAGRARALDDDVGALGNQVAQVRRRRLARRSGASRSPRASGPCRAGPSSMSRAITGPSWPASPARMNDPIAPAPEHDDRVARPHARLGDTACRPTASGCASAASMSAQPSGISRSVRRRSGDELGQAAVGAQPERVVAARTGSCGRAGTRRRTRTRRLRRRRPGARPRLGVRPGLDDGADELVPEDGRADVAAARMRRPSSGTIIGPLVYSVASVPQSPL